MKTIGKILREKGILLLLAGILCVYFGAICLINFSGRPGFYCTDMYADMVFAAKAWEQKSLIPEGWLFGNQLYVVATPALAALYCSVTTNPQIAMALAAVTMTVLILAAFWWMLKAVFSSAEEKLLCMVLFMTLGLYFGDSIGTVIGWQLFFTMCAYYACYLLNALLGFGCYLHADEKVGRGFWLVLGFTCVLSFGTGMQSLRQTAIMSGPLMGLACLQMLTDLRKKENWKRRSAVCACLITLFNILGLLYKETVEFQQTEIFGQMGLAESGQMLPAVGESLNTMLELLAGETAEATVMRIVLLLFCGIGAGELCFRKGRKERKKPLQLAVLLVLSLLAILAIDVATILKVRDIYYFLFYLLLAFLGTCVFAGRKKIGRWLCLLGLALTLVLPSMLALKDICMQAYFARYDPIYEVSDFLVEEDYDTVYAPWNLGEDIAIASDFEIAMGFWDKEFFVPVEYLCDPQIYEVDSSRCVYAMYGSESAELAGEKVKQKGLSWDLLKAFPELRIYLYTSSKNLMQEFSK